MVVVVGDLALSVCPQSFQTGPEARRLKFGGFQEYLTSFAKHRGNCLPESNEGPSVDPVVEYSLKGVKASNREADVHIQDRTGRRPALDPDSDPALGCPARPALLPEMQQGAFHLQHCTNDISNNTFCCRHLQQFLLI